MAWFLSPCGDRTLCASSCDGMLILSQLFILVLLAYGEFFFSLMQSRCCWYCASSAYVGSIRKSYLLSIFSKYWPMRICPLLEYFVVTSWSFSGSRSGETVVMWLLVAGCWVSKTSGTRSGGMRYSCKRWVWRALM